jgi:hypothetical protein
MISNNKIVAVRLLFNNIYHQEGMAFFISQEDNFKDD